MRNTLIAGTKDRVRHGLWIAGLACCVVMAASAASMAQSEEAARQAKRAEAARARQQHRLPVFTEEREAAARVFLEKHQPKLLGIMDELKTSNADDYRHAMRGFFQTSEHLADVRERQSERYPSVLRMWQAQSGVHVAVAALTRDESGEPADSTVAALHEAVEQMMKIRVQEADRRIAHLQGQLEEARKHRQQLGDNIEQMVRQQVDAMLQNVRKQRGNRSDGDNSSDGGTP